MVINNTIVSSIDFLLILEFNPVLYGAQVVAQMDKTRRLDSR
jgi:hypothetical protein